MSPFPYLLSLNNEAECVWFPGHNPTRVAFYDRNTELFFSGDFLMPGRLLIDDADADSGERKAGLPLSSRIAR